MLKFLLRLADTTPEIRKKNKPSSWNLMGLTSQKQKAAVYAKIEVFQKKADVDSHRITVSEQTESKEYKCVPKARVETAPEKHNCSNDELLK